MGVFDDIKDSIGGSRSSSSSGSDVGDSSDFGGSDSFNDDQFDESFGNDQPDQSSGRSQNQGLDQNSQQGMEQQNNRGSQREDSLGSPNQRPSSQQMNSQNSAREHGRDIRNGSTGQSRQPESSPNAQAGRPQQGSSEPQLSSQTRRKLDNAGFSDPSPPEQGRDQRQNNPQRNSTESVAERQDDLEQIKSQNQQIIELLKRINQSLNGSQGNF